jgi:hypothetical protein
MSMTDWTQIARCAGPNPETFPEGEQVYLFGSMARLKPSQEWFRAFRTEAEAHGMRVEVRDTPLGFCLFVVVPDPETDALGQYNEMCDQAS